mmetsp:Transcript_16827/g.49560  ORF Transcript_16827/g.49560 Transcript_16827/m.49560 type:complete len:263 (+) Transcript_16827:311-1099(+)
MTVAERKALAEAWVPAAQEHKLYTIINVGTTVQADAIELAVHAASIGADAIAAVPPYYNTAATGDILAVLRFLQPVAAAAGELPFFYYHIPGMTRTPLGVAELFRVAAEGEVRIATMAGVKYVDTNMTDWLDLVTNYNESHALLFAPEPKLQSFAFGLGRGTVLAEDFYAPTYLRMRHAYLQGDVAAARAEQQWKFDASNAFGTFGNSKTAAERAVYRWLCDIDIGPPRPPKDPLAPADLPALKAALEAVDFFNKVKLNPAA